MTMATSSHTPTAQELDDDIRAERRASRRASLRATMIPIATVTALILLWQGVVTWLQVPSYIAPAPTQVVGVMISDWDNLLANLWPTLIESLAGFALGNIIAVILATVFVYSRTAEQAFYPLAVFVNTIPILAVAPILVLLFGPGMTGKVVIAALISFFPTLVNMVRGLRSLSPQMLELARICSATPAEVFWKFRLPASLPYLFSALRIAATTCVIGALVGEWIGSDKGLGALIIEATFNYRSGLLYATVILSSGLSVFLFAMVALAERVFLRWRPE
ncbi:ABC transporter permease [Pseudooceanicola algae]|uniref:Riboflavin transport system permease protein RibX n=1 Tax=Pseudooceanicola algae TaxID=1537215 RepID=A0A418SJ64_9RHOB|nr:ABC transporter permease [Pseudooceanicola algae]QPM90141.1 Riboflavin transport system permease protein RibX [Pseudooceanicola algae]